jgi:hypothetical protein
MPREELETERISWFMNQLWRFYVETIHFKFVKALAESIKEPEKFPIVIIRAKEEMPMFTQISGINLNIYTIFIDNKDAGEIRLTTEGICYCIEKDYEKEFSNAINKNINLYV